MWNQLACKPKLKVKQQRSDIKRHRAALGLVKPVIDNKPPTAISHLQCKRKKLQLAEGSL